MKSNLGTKKIQLLVFISFFILVELFLRILGHLPGTLEASLYPVEKLIIEPQYQADSNGISSYIAKAKRLPNGYHINKEGFRSDLEFNKNVIDSLRKKEKKSVIMLVGDSYTEGCCAEPISNSFADLLYEDNQQILLNFGVGVTDLVQYKLIVEKYLPKLKPDLLVVAFYLGNDIPYYDRPITPNIPVCYIIKDYPWLNSIKDPYLLKPDEKNYLSSHEEAYSYYLNQYTLWGNKATALEKVIRPSIIFSKIYLGIRLSYNKISWGSKKYEFNQRESIAKKLLHQINETCKTYKTKMLVLTIPSPIDVKNQVNLKGKYEEHFKGLNVAYPNNSIFSLADYDGATTANHFNNSGHRKCYSFMRKRIDKSFSDLNQN